MRQRLTLLVDNFADDVDALNLPADAARHRRGACESRRVSEDLLPRDVLSDLLDNPAHGARIPLEWFYTHLTVESMFSVNDTIVCKIVIPFVHPVVYQSIDVITLPVPSANDSGFIRLCNNFGVAISTASDELFFTDECLGSDPLICPGTARFPVAQFPCISGLLDGNIELQRLCPLTYMRSVNTHEHLYRLSINVYVGYFRESDYYYRCLNSKPMFGHLAPGPYIVQLEADCMLDLEGFTVSGTRELSAHYEFAPSNLQVIEATLFDEIPWRDLSEYLTDYPHVESLKLSDIASFPSNSLATRIDRVQGSIQHYSVWYRSWWFGVLLASLLIGGVLVLIKNYPVLRKRWTRHPSELQREDLTNPPVEIPQLRATVRETTSLYPPLPDYEDHSEHQV
jgi:hypothetical protein